MAFDGPGVLRAALLALGALLVLLSAYPYLLDVVQGRTRPRLFSWITWTLLGAIATGAAYVEGEYASATLTAAATLETGAIAIVGWQCGNRIFERLDAVCLGGVVVGLLLWDRYESPLVGLSAALTIDLLAAVPTVRHAWRRPHEETTLAYVLCAAAAVCSLAAMPRLTLMGSLYPVYLLAVNGGIAALTMRAPQRSAHSAGERGSRCGQSAGRHRAVPRAYRRPPAAATGSPRRLAPAAPGAAGVLETGGRLEAAPVRRTSVPAPRSPASLPSQHRGPHQPDRRSTAGHGHEQPAIASAAAHRWQAAARPPTVPPCRPTGYSPIAPRHGRDHAGRGAGAASVPASSSA